MSIKISLKKNINNKLVKNYVLFCNENFKINGFNKLPIKSKKKDIDKLINLSFRKDKDFLLFNISSFQRLILIKIKNDISSVEIEKKGAEFLNFIKLNSINDITFFENNIIDTKKKIIIF